ncbi:hypothetical protein ACI2VR_05310 [Ralstonia nicotianae]
MSLDDVPDDFPQSAFPTIVPSVRHNFDAALPWHFYVACVPPEGRYDRWAFCEGLAKQLLLFAQDEASRHPGQSSEDTLGRVWVAVARKGWVSLAELDWLVLRMKALLQW